METFVLSADDPDDPLRDDRYKIVRCEVSETAEGRSVPFLFLSNSICLSLSHFEHSRAHSECSRQMDRSLGE